MSRRGGRGARERPADADASRQNHGEPGRESGLVGQIVLLVAVFLVTTAIADLIGAANLGVAAGIGQMGFALALVAVLLRNR